MLWNGPAARYAWELGPRSLFLLNSSRTVRNFFSSALGCVTYPPPPSSKKYFKVAGCMFENIHKSTCTLRLIPLFSRSCHWLLVCVWKKDILLFFFSNLMSAPCVFLVLLI